jgi:hypothetical protein
MGTEVIKKILARSMVKHLLQQPFFYQNAEVHLNQNCSKDFKPIHTALLLHRIMRLGYLRACGRNWLDSQRIWAIKAVIQYSSFRQDQC